MVRLTRSLGHPQGLKKDGHCQVLLLAQDTPQMMINSSPNAILDRPSPGKTKTPLSTPQDAISMLVTKKQ